MCSSLLQKKKKKEYRLVYIITSYYIVKKNIKYNLGEKNMFMCIVHDVHIWCTLMTSQD